MYSSSKDPGFPEYHVKALDSSVQVQQDDGSAGKNLNLMTTSERQKPRLEDQLHQHTVHSNAKQVNVQVTQNAEVAPV